jgi:hypothetical protein
MSKISNTFPSESRKTAVEVETLVATETTVLEDSHIYVHCEFPIHSPGMLMRIWKTTFLKDLHSAAKAELIHAENISYAPQWTLIPDRGTFSFLLIFSSLPKSCTHFDLVEDIPQPGGFHVRNIQRNNKDVYRVVIE